MVSPVQNTRHARNHPLAKTTQITIKNTRALHQLKRGMIENFTKKLSCLYASFKQVNVLCRLLLFSFVILLQHTATAESQPFLRTKEVKV